MDLSEFYEVFYEECYEGLEIMENGLVELDIGAADVEEINTIFRAAHSIKGGSATFDFTEIAGFTHVMETLLDQMRSAERDVTVPAVDLLLESVDCLREMVDATKSSESIDNERVDVLKDKLEKMLEDKDSISSESSEDLDNESSTETSSNRFWEIEFHPYPEMLLPGNEPLSIFSALEEMGKTTVTCLNQELPSVKEMDPKLLFMGWKIELSGDVDEDQIREVFAWVEDVSRFTIKEGKLNDTKNGENIDEISSSSDSVSVEKEEEKEPVISQKAKEIDKPEKKSSAKSGNNTKKDTRKKNNTSKPEKKSPSAEGGSIRVSVEKIDALINLVGELVITQSMLGRFGEHIDLSDIEDLRDGLGQLERNSRELQETAMQIRMLPISSSFNRFPRLIRDLSGKLNKKVELKITGENTELDKTVLEKIGDPLVHLVRNSLDHGLETPEIRRANGKPETGVIELNAYHEGGNIVIEVVDDGAGLNKDRILSKAIEKNVISKDENLTDQEIYNLIFQAGFSTAEVVSDVSGRGVGMDVILMILGVMFISTQGLVEAAY